MPVGGDLPVRNGDDPEAAATDAAARLGLPVIIKPPPYGSIGVPVFRDRASPSCEAGMSGR
ncbi:hypothetical protein AB0442_39675 [Kitasatospora sp. NPDC085895]|uniref:hypothetical protein n=1 Tax=Kitasatospora sp. NPDC085895 TaxID=3155057 RepID=UPI00344C3649